MTMPEFSYETDPPVDGIWTVKIMEDGKQIAVIHTDRDPATFEPCRDIIEARIKELVIASLNL